MNPRSVVAQARLMCTLLVLMPMFLPWWVAVLAAVAELAPGVLLSRSFRRHGKRRADDGRVLKWLMAGGLIPLGVSAGAAAYGHAVGHVPVADENGIAALLLFAGFAAVAIYLSSLVDWYYILPHISGLTSQPPCRSSGLSLWRDLTRNWYRHRWAAELMTVLSLFGLAASASYFWIGNTDRSLGTAALAGVASIGATGIAVVRIKGLGHVTAEALHSNASVGDVLEIAGDPSSRWYYVVDVANEGMKVIELDDMGRYDGEPFRTDNDRCIPVQDIGRLKRKTKRFHGCDDGACSGVNWYCQQNPDGGRGYRKSSPRPASEAAVRVEGKRHIGSTEATERGRQGTNPST